MTFALVAALVIAVSGTHANVINVPGDFPTIQQAINAAQDGDEIIVAPGTYAESINLLGKTITLRSSGGAELTTIDATGLDARVVTIDSGEGPETLVEGFTITGGNPPPPSASSKGGGVLVDAPATISNCIITGNTAINGGGVYADGGATLIDCVISANEADSAGGISAREMTAMNSTISDNAAQSGGAVGSDSPIGNWTTVFQDCHFVANTYTSAFSAAINWWPWTASIKFINCRFSDHPGLVLYLHEPTNSSITGCVFQNNERAIGIANYHSGFVSVHVVDSTFVGHWGSPVRTGGEVLLFLTNCTFENNSAEHGGAIRHGCIGDTGARCPRTIISGSSFINNHAAGDGGAIFTGCAIGEYSGKCSRTTISASVFIGNTAGGFGGVLSNNCVYFDNPDAGPPYWGCGEVSISNSTMKQNIAGSGGGALANLIESFATLSSVTFCQNLPEAILGDWVDEGGNVFSPPPDLNCDGSVGVADLLILLARWGPCEDCPDTPCPADLNDDCNVGVSDLLVLLSNWG